MKTHFKNKKVKINITFKNTFLKTGSIMFSFARYIVVVN